MKIKCGNCGIEGKGNHKKLKRGGWRMFFLGNNLKFGRCQKCRPVFPGFYEEIGNHITKLKIINSLKTDEESGNKTFERLTKKRRLSRCKYRRTKKNY